MTHQGKNKYTGVAIVHNHLQDQDHYLLEQEQEQDVQLADHVEIEEDNV